MFTAIHSQRGKMKKTLLIILICLICLHIFGDDFYDEYQRNLFKFIEQPYHEISPNSFLYPISTLDDFIISNGKPLQIKEEQHKNPYNDSIDTIYILDYGLFEYYIYHVTHLSKNIIHQFKILNSEEVLNLGLSFDIRFEHLFELFGEPRDISSNSGKAYVHYLYEESMVNIFFVFIGSDLEYIYFNSAM